MHERFGDAGSAAEIAIDLERRVIVEEIGQCRLRKKRTQVVLDGLSVTETCEEIDEPRAAPTSVAAAVCQAEIERFARCCEKFWCGVAVELRTRMQAEEMRNVTVSWLCFAERTRPLHQTSICADRWPREIVARHTHTLREFVVIAREHLRGIEQVREDIPNDGLIHRVAHTDIRLLTIGRDERVLRRRTRTSNKLASRRIDTEVIEIELCARGKRRPRALAQEQLITRVRIVLEVVPRQPAAAVRPHAPHSEADRLGKRPRIARVMHHRATRAVEFFRRNTAVLNQSIGECKQRFMALGEVRRLRVPVVHLNVDVRVVVGVPWCREMLVPQALQVRRKHATRARTREEQVSTELEIEREERGIIRAISEFREAHIGGLRRLRR